MNAMSVDDPMQFSCLVEQSILHGGHHMVINGHMGYCNLSFVDSFLFVGINLCNFFKKYYLRKK